MFMYVAHLEISIAFKISWHLKLNIWSFIGGINYAVFLPSIWFGSKGVIKCHRILSNYSWFVNVDSELIQFYILFLASKYLPLYSICEKFWSQDVEVWTWNKYSRLYMIKESLSIAVASKCDTSKINFAQK